MATEEANNNKRTELIMDEFLFKTIVSLQVTLSTISNDLSQKTDLLHDVTDSLTAISYNMHEVRDRLEKKDNTELYHGIEDLGKKMQLLEVKLERDNNQIQENIKEIKYVIQQLSSSLIEMKTEKRVRNEDVNPEKKFDIFEALTSAWEAIKNVKTIFYIILALAVVFAALSGGSEFFSGILEILNNLLKG